MNRIFNMAIVLYVRPSLFVVGLVFCAVFPLHALAADVYFEVVSNTVVGDEAAIIEAYIDPQGETLNVVEGTISLQNTEAKISSVLIESGGSLLTLWPTAPEYAENEQVVRFIGGAPQGFNQSGLLFRMRIFAAESGNATLSWIGGSAYKNDGRGSPEPISSRSLVVSLTRGFPNQINPASADSVPPQFDTIKIGSHPSMYGGKYFISFHATDDISGIARYEVTEGQIVTEVTNGIYVLNDQEMSTPLFITAHDQAGNSKTVEVPLTENWFMYGTLIVLGIFILAVLWYVRRTYIQE